MSALFFLQQLKLKHMPVDCLKKQQLFGMYSRNVLWGDDLQSFLFFLSGQKEECCFFVPLYFDLWLLGQILFLCQCRYACQRFFLLFDKNAFEEGQ